MSTGPPPVPQSAVKAPAVYGNTEGGTEEDSYLEDQTGEADQSVVSNISSLLGSPFPSQNPAMATPSSVLSRKTLLTRRGSVATSSTANQGIEIDAVALSGLLYKCNEGFVSNTWYERWCILKGNEM